MTDKDKAALFDAIVSAIKAVGLAEFKQTSFFGKEQWRLIETAPKDGTRILTWNGEYQATVEWDDEYWRGDGRIGPDPTHWMPLPEPPKS